MFILRHLLNLLPEKSKPVFFACVFGLGAGFSAVAFELLINLIYEATFVRFSHWSIGWFLFSSFCLIMGVSALSGFLLNRYAPDAAGSGIPQLKLAFWKDFGFVPFRTVWVKFLAGVLTVGGGVSLGREGPTVQLGGGIASHLSGLFGTPKNGRRRAAAAGAAAGLAAAFNTPLAAIAFVLEEIIGDLNSQFIGTVVAASVLGAFAVHAMIGQNPAFVLRGVNSLSWRGYVLIPVVSFLSTLIGAFFQISSLRLRKKLKKIPENKNRNWLYPVLGGFITWGIGCFVFISTGHLGVFSLGYQDVTSALAGNITGLLPLILLIGKLVATIAAYGSGGCGGVFAPSLFFGAMCGSTVASLCQILGFHLSSEDILLISVVAMSTCLGAVVRAPLTSILIVFEMTRQFSLIPALLIGGLISQAFVRMLLSHSFYDQILVDDGHHLHAVVPPRDFRSWQNYPVSAIANFQPIVIHDLSPERLRDFLSSQPYRYFPVEMEGSPVQILGKREALFALEHHHSLSLESAVTCLRDDSILAAQRLLVESPHGVVFVLDALNGKVIGIVTLHDLLRAQQALAAQDALH